jgi:hypothetical protein
LNPPGRTASPSALPTVAFDEFCRRLILSRGHRGPCRGHFPDSAWVGRVSCRSRSLQDHRTSIPVRSIAGVGAFSEGGSYRLQRLGTSISGATLDGTVSVTGSVYPNTTRKGMSDWSGYVQLMLPGKNGERAFDGSVNGEVRQCLMARRVWRAPFGSLAIRSHLDAKRLIRGSRCWIVLSQKSNWGKFGAGARQ